MGAHVLRDDFVNEKEEIEHFDIASYNIFENPVYQRIFNISSDFAAHHKHLEDLGNLDQLAGANLKDDTEGP